MTEIKELPITQIVDYKNSKVMVPFEFYSDILGKWCSIPVGFKMDWESVPVIRATSKESGLIHDYLYRRDSIPLVNKKTADQVYLEFLLFFGTDRFRAYFKYWTVRIFTSYFHKKTVFVGGLKNEMFF